VQAGDQVLEIGPGLGTLTDELLKVGVQLHVAELDRAAIAFLRDTYGDRIEIMEGDVLRVRLDELQAQWGAYHVVANIPYNITSKIIRLLAESPHGPQTFTLMIQKEVAERVTAQAGDMSILAVATQLYGEVTYHFDVPKVHFWPQPQVDSAVITFRRSDRYRAQLNVSDKDFFRMVKFGFAARRKKLVNNLVAGLRISADEVKQLLDSVGIGSDVRAQELSMENWIGLANEWGVRSS